MATIFRIFGAYLLAVFIANIASIPRTHAQGVGVSVNGTCQVGACPPAALALGTGTTRPYFLTITLPNGDRYSVAGRIDASVNAAGNFVPATQFFTVGYLGNPSGTPSQADTLTFHNFLAFTTNGGAFNLGAEGTGLFSAAPAVAATSSVRVSAVFNGSISSPTFGPFLAPNPFSQTANVFVPAGSSVLTVDTTFTIVFGAGSPIGSSIQIGALRPGVFAAVLPGARTSSPPTPTPLGFGTPVAFSAVTAFSPVTAFATIINTGQVVASACAITLPPNIAGDFIYQTTNPVTNQPTGTPNTPVDIPVGQNRSFVFAITPTAPFTLDIPLLFACNNAVPATPVAGVNTFLLTSSNTPIPDMLSIAATPTNDGILHVPTNGSAAFAEAAINISAAGTVTFTPTTTAVGQPQRNLPLGLTICLSNPSTGACLNPATTSATVTAAANQIVTLSIFAQGQGQSIALDPANSRIFIIATQGTTVVGASSVAVQSP